MKPDQPCTRKRDRKNANLEEDTRINLEDIDHFLDAVKTINQNKPIQVTKQKKNELRATNSFLGSKHKTENKKLSEAHICYKLKNETQELIITEDAGKFKCPICEGHVKNINLHFSKNLRCQNKIDRIHF